MSVLVASRKQHSIRRKLTEAEAASSPVGEAHLGVGACPVVAAVGGEDVGVPVGLRVAFTAVPAKDEGTVTLPAHCVTVAQQRQYLVSIFPAAVQKDGDTDM